MGFEVGMRVEVVDRRNPILVRVATIQEVKEHQVLVHFDGWPEIYDYWVDDDSPDIKPPGWCSRTGGTLQPPFGEQSVNVNLSLCVTPHPPLHAPSHPILRTESFHPSVDIQANLHLQP